MQSILLIGCGRLGSALVDGWLTRGGVRPDALTLAVRSPKPAAERAVAAGARLAFPGSRETADIVVLAVKPAAWREAVAGLEQRPPGVLVSVMAGIRAESLSEALPGWRIVRVMPTTGVATGRGAAAWWSEADEGEAVVDRLFKPVATTVRLDDEGDLDIATAASGSGQAYVLAFAESLARAAMGEGLDAATATALARATLASAAAMLIDGRSLEALIAEVASPGGTTEAGLRALASAGLDDAVAEAVAAALARSRELAQTP